MINEEILERNCNTKCSRYWSSDKCPEVDGNKQWHAYFADDRVRFGTFNRDCGLKVSLVIS